jgi:hypothetical protein
MKIKGIFQFFINLSFLMVLSLGTAQNEEKTSVENDSIVLKTKYGLRFGVDTGRILRSVLDDEYEGIEFVSDYRLTKKLYIALEGGMEERTIVTSFLNTTTEGSYIKAGIDYNVYENWLDMDNSIFFGPRVGVSRFSHTINEYQVFATNQFFAPQNFVDESLELDNLTAIWLELIFGIKAELFRNLYLGLNVQLKVEVSSTEPENFENIYIPGFNRTYDSTRIGVGYGYTLSYRIPLYNKKRKIAKAK